MRSYELEPSGLRKGWIAAAVFLAALLILVFLSFAKIDTVQVSGNERYTAEQIETLVFDTKLSRNSVYCYLNHRFRPHKTIPFVEDYEIVFRSLNRVEIIVYEKSVVGYVSYMNSNMYFDKDGIIVESTSGHLPGIPQVTGLKFGHIVLHQPLPVQDAGIFNEILNLTQMLAVNEIQVSEIHFDKDRNATLSIGELRVELGSNSQMNGKLSELSDILADYPSLAGTLYLDTYDESNSNPMYRFEKKQELVP